MSLKAFKPWQVCPFDMYYILWQSGVSALPLLYVVQSVTLLVVGLEYYKKITIIIMEVQTSNHRTSGKHVQTSNH